MKKSVYLLAAVPAVCIGVSAGLLCWIQKDKNSISVQLETRLGESFYLDGVCIEAELYNNLDSSFRAAGGGVWKQTITFENGQPQVENSFSPQLREYRYMGYHLPSQLSVGIDNSAAWDQYTTLEALPVGEYTLSSVLAKIEKDGCRFVGADDFLLPVGNVQFGQSAVLEIPVPADTALTVEEGETEGQPYKRATYSDVYLPQVYAQGVEVSDGMIFTLPDTGLMDLQWEPSETIWTNRTQDGHWSSITSGGTSNWEQTAPESVPPAEYTLHSGVFFLPAEQEFETETAVTLFSMDCTRDGSHILGMCALNDSQAALLTIENGWYSVRTVSLPDGAVSEAVPLQLWNGEAVNEAQLQVQDGMLLVRINVTENNDMQNWFFAADCTGEPCLVMWCSDTSAWDNGREASGNSWWELLWHDERILVANLQSTAVDLVLLGQDELACYSKLYSYGPMLTPYIAGDHPQMVWQEANLRWDESTMKVWVDFSAQR